ncbi:MAG: hypothetical protein ACD_75C01840G0001 [uncultured bacterium]|nr:MAG: hypothetical protein ACD_75C01840G0001 [uncultured bacterium]
MRPIEGFGESWVGKKILDQILEILRQCLGQPADFLFNGDILRRTFGQRFDKSPVENFRKDCGDGDCFYPVDRIFPLQIAALNRGKQDMPHIPYGNERQILE